MYVSPQDTEMVIHNCIGVDIDWYFHSSPIVDSVYYIPVFSGDMGIA